MQNLNSTDSDLNSIASQRWNQRYIHAFPAWPCHVQLQKMAHVLAKTCHCTNSPCTWQVNQPWFITHTTLEHRGSAHIIATCFSIISKHANIIHKFGHLLTTPTSLTDHKTNLKYSFYQLLLLPLFAILKGERSCKVKRSLLDLINKNWALDSLHDFL